MFINETKFLNETKNAEHPINNIHYLSADMGIHDLCSCHGSLSDNGLQLKKYLSVCRKCAAENERLQSQCTLFRIQQNR